MPALLSRHPLLLPFLFAAAALGMAFVSQVGFGTHPCHLCLLQRYPYGVALALCALALMIRKRPVTRTVLLLCALAFLTTTAMGGWHVAVEHGWVEASDACAAGTATVGSLEELKRQIMGAPLVSCADVGASFAGISMPLWNMMYGVFAAALTLHIWNQQRVAA